MHRARTGVEPVRAFLLLAATVPCRISAGGRVTFGRPKVTKRRMPPLRSARLRRDDCPAMLATGGRAETRPLRGLRQPARLFRRRLRVSAEQKARKTRFALSVGFRSRLNVAEHRSRRWISRRAAPSEAGMPKPLQSGQDGPSATPTGCEKRRAPAAAGGWPRSRAHFLFASFLCASKEKGLARQGETRGPAAASHLSRREGWTQIGLRTPHSHPQSPTARPPVQYP